MIIPIIYIVTLKKTEVTT